MKAPKRGQGADYRKMLSFIRTEAAFIVTAISTVILYTVGADWLKDLSNPIVFAALFVWIFGPNNAWKEIGMGADIPVPRIFFPIM